MKIVYMDAPRHLAEKVAKLEIPNFIIEVIRHLERDYYRDYYDEIEIEIICGVHSSHNTTLPLSPIWKFKEPEYENIATLIHTIPIYLRDSKPEEIRDENSIIDLLGAYYSNRNGDSPYIELFLSAIDNSINNDENHFKWLFTKVLIHELAHAALDIFPDFVNASPTRNSLTHKPQRERDILKTSRIGYGGAILFISQRVTQTKIITSDYQIVTFAL